MIELTQNDRKVKCLRDSRFIGGIASLEGDVVDLFLKLADSDRSPGRRAT